MKSIRRILVAIKNPDQRRQDALEKAAHLARELGASLELFHALSTQAFYELRGLNGRSLAQLRREATAIRTRRLEKLAARVRTLGVRAHVSVAWDYPPHDAIVRHANGRADLIVAAVHAGQRTGSWFLQLTDWELLRQSPVPVLIVKNRRPWRGPAILAAVDPSHARAKPAALDPQIVAAGKSLARGLDGTLHLVHANYPAFRGVAIGDAAVGALTLADEYEILKERGAAVFERFARQHHVPAARRHLVDGDPETAIVEAAKRLNADVVVMGAIARSALKRWFIGHTAERILNALPCDVLVVRPPRRPKGDRT